MKAREMSWGWIIFWIILFWPVGLYLAIKKNSSKVKPSIINRKTGPYTVFGWILIVYGVFAFLGGIGIGSILSDSLGGIAGGVSVFYVFIAAAMIAGGILLLRKASKIKQTAIRYKKYIDIVVNQNVKSIDNIANAVGLSYDAVVNDLQNMINTGDLKDAYIRQAHREIVVKHHAPVANAQEPIMLQKVSQKKAIRCPGCGASNVVVVGGVSICAYCDTPINT